MKIIQVFIAFFASSAQGKTCQLFDVDCSMAKGFTISINQTCLSENYEGLDLSEGGFFVHANQSLDDATNEPLMVDSGCYLPLNQSESISVKFSECGDVEPINNDNEDYSKFITHIHHKLNISNTLVSLMDQQKIECQIGYAELETGGVNRTANDEILAQSAVDSATLVSDYNLKLEIGTGVGNNFTKASASKEWDIGSIISLQLKADTNPYSFSLHDCKASSGSNNLNLFNDHCPIPSLADKLNIEWNDHTDFQLSVFKMSTENSLTFTCTVKVYIEESDLPADCPAKRRRRRETEPENEVSVSLKIRESEETSIYDDKKTDSGAKIISTSAAFIFGTFMLNNF